VSHFTVHAASFSLFVERSRRLGVAELERRTFALELSGIYPAIVTPFHADGVFHASIFEKHILRLYEAGVDGLYVLGQTGEGALQSVKQRKLVLEAAVRSSPPGKQIIVHVGAGTTLDAIELARHAESAGAHFISSLPPIGSYNYAEIRSYYEALAASTKLPLLLYRYPETCPEITPERALDLCSIPNVVGFKFTDFNLFLLTLLRARGKTILYGRDEQFAAGLMLGACGGIGTFYNIFPRLFVAIFRFAQREEWSEAARLQLLVNPVLKSIFDAELLPATREILKLQGFPCGDALLPRALMSKTARSALRQVMHGLPTELEQYLIRA
jgi:N-acetylneuraminate lyase